MSDPFENPAEDTSSRFRRLLNEFREADTQPLAETAEGEAGGEPAAGAQSASPTSDAVDEGASEPLADAETSPLVDLPTQVLEPDAETTLEMQADQEDEITRPDEPVAEFAQRDPVPQTTGEKPADPTHSGDTQPTRSISTSDDVLKGNTQPTAAARAVSVDSPKKQASAFRITRPAAETSNPPPAAGTQAGGTQPRPYSTTQAGTGSRSSVPPDSYPQVGRLDSSRAKGIDWRTSLGCLLRMAILGLFGLVVIVIVVISIGVYQYFRIAATLPDVEGLRDKAAQFETTRIYDRNGSVLYEVLDPTAGRRTYVPLEKISPFMLAATLATEDKDFYSHPGFNPLAIFRAFLQNYSSGEVVSGASTITQQLARNLLFTPEERSEQTYQRKIREAILATEITRLYSKSDILELYLNENNYGNLAYGVEAAAETYFGTASDKLTLAQAAFLGGLPQAPYVYDVYNNRDVTMARTEQVLSLMVQTSQEQGCIYVSNNNQPICIDVVQAVDAANIIKTYNFKNPDVQIVHPHWVTYIRSQLESMFDPQEIYRSGFSVYTTSRSCPAGWGRNDFK